MTIFSFDEEAETDGPNITQIPEPFYANDTSVSNLTNAFRLSSAFGTTETIRPAPYSTQTDQSASNLSLSELQDVLPELPTVSASPAALHPLAPPASRPIAIASRRRSVPRRFSLDKSVPSQSPSFRNSYEVPLQPLDPASSQSPNPASPADLYVPRVSDFRPLKVLGKGAYGTVLLVQQKHSGRLYAQKQLKKASLYVSNDVEKSRRSIGRSLAEKSILTAVRHPFIVKLFYALQDSNKIYLLLEYVQGGELFSHLAARRYFSEPVAAFYVAEMALALYHLHTNVGVVYRDLKPENCLLDAAGHLVLTDFGLSKVGLADAETTVVDERPSNGAEKFNSIIGTPEYMAPEILQGKEYDFSVDYWSLGTVLYNLLTGSPPFTGNNHKVIFDKITKTKKLKFPVYFTAEARDLTTRLLRKNPEKRLSDKDFNKSVKTHPFFRKIDWEKLEARDPEIIPPIVPKVTDPTLAENFDAEFTSLPFSPVGSVGVADAKMPNSLFKGFSYVASSSYIESAFAEAG